MRWPSWPSHSPAVRTFPLLLEKSSSHLLVMSSRLTQRALVQKLTHTMWQPCWSISLDWAPMSSHPTRFSSRVLSAKSRISMFQAPMAMLPITSLTMQMARPINSTSIAASDSEARSSTRAQQLSRLVIMLPLRVRLSTTRVTPLKLLPTTVSSSS